MRTSHTVLIFALVGCEGVITGPVAQPVGEQGQGTPQPGQLPEPAELPVFSPAPLRVRLLLSTQYQNSITDLFGAEAAAATAPLRDAPVNGLTAIGASQLSVSGAAIDAYETNAYLAAQAALKARRAQLVPCTPANTSDAACMHKVAELHVARAFRRPATEVELARWTQVGVTVARQYDAFDRGVEFLLAGLLQSPAFLYLDEVGAPDPLNAARRRLTDWELASRLSYFLTSGPPDDPLRAAAASGELSTDEGLRTQARRLLKQPRARQAMTQLFDELLDLNQLEHLAKDAQKFPGFKAALGLSMREETRRTLVDLAFDTPTDFREVFTRRTTFVDAALAEHYGLPAVTGWTQVQLPPERAGVLTQASFLSLQSHPSQNSPTYRGKFIRERLLCQAIPAPPPNVSTTLPDPPPNTQRTLRQKLELHMQNASCSGCHKQMDPVGFGFEGFDAIGRRQTLDDGLPVDSSGSLDTRGSYTDAPGLMQVLHDDPRVMSCLARVVFRQGVGHVDLPTEGRPLREAEQAFIASGYRYQSLLEALVVTEAFRTGTLEAP